MAGTLLPLRAAGTSSAAYTAGYTPMMLNSAVNTVFTCGQATVLTQWLVLCALAWAELSRSRTRLHSVVLADADDLLNEVLIPQWRLARRQRKSVICTQEHTWSQTLLSRRTHCVRMLDV